MLWSPLRFSSCLLSAANFGDEESLGFYRKDEAYSAARFSSFYALERTLDGRAGDRPRCVRAPSRISTVMRIILCSPFPRRRSRGQPLRHEVWDEIPGDIDFTVVTLV